MSKDFRQEALDYHAKAKDGVTDLPGKIGIEVTKSTATAHDLALAYSPGVAEPVKEIANNPKDAFKYTNKGNLVAVISNGSAILGLGNLGPLASKPVMEGKSLLFKRFAGIDSIDIEVDTQDADEFINIVEKIADTFGGINLEDIKAPECFKIEQTLIQRCKIPVFHDDQHGTAIVTAAGLLNALEIQNKNIQDIKLVCIGAGSAAISCAKLLISFGLQKHNLTMLDSKGVIHTGRDNLTSTKQEFAIATDARTLADACQGADVILGLSGPDIVTPEMVQSLADKPIIFACSNPNPEIKPALALSVRDDLIMATGRSDYPNQVNNVLGFPFIFRAALDVRATAINEEMKKACALALKDLAKEPVPQDVLDAYKLDSLEFGKNYIIPKPLDARLNTYVVEKIKQAARDSGVAGL